jgi:hypothetical protein
MGPRVCLCCGKTAEQCDCRFESKEVDTEHQCTWCLTHQRIVEKTLQEVDSVDEAVSQA